MCKTSQSNPTSRRYNRYGGNTWKNRLKEKNIAIEFTDSVINKLSEKGFDKVYGARPLRRAIQTNIEDKFAEEMLDLNIKENSSVKIDLKDDKIVIK